MEGDRFCTRCGERLPADATFCPGCGAHVDHDGHRAEEDGSQGFCTRCGAVLPNGAAVCPECGSPIDGALQDAAPGYGYGYAAVRQSGYPGFVILFLLYGVFALILGAMDAVTSLGYDEASYNDFIQQMTDISGVDFSSSMPAWSSDMPVRMCMAMVFMAVSGALAVACYYTSRIMREWKTSVILCAASSVACLGMMCSEFYMSLGILMFVIGVVFTFLLYTSKSKFAGPL